MAGGVLLQSAATSGNGNAWNCRGLAGEYSFSIETSNATVSAGAVQLEEAVTPDYTGTWQAIEDAITPVQNSVIVVKKRGAYGAVRARLSTAVTGGASVTVRMQPPLDWGGE